MYNSIARYLDLINATKFEGEVSFQYWGQDPGVYLCDGWPIRHL